VSAARHAHALSWPRRVAQQANDPAGAADKDPAQELKKMLVQVKTKEMLFAFIKQGTAQRYTQLDLPVRPIWDMLLNYSVSEDGALHAEKYYRTATAEYAASCSAFRARQVIALARVTASAHGHAAPGHSDACRLLHA